MNPLLQIVDLTVSLNGHPLLQEVNLTVEPGEIHVVFGPNASGKSSLIKTIMGLPPYVVTEGDIRFNGESIMDMSIDERARLGIGLAFQHPPTVRDVPLSALGQALGIDPEQLTEEAGRLEFDGHISRGLNDGFSGGEQKRSELLQLILQGPQLFLLDEPESGVDMDSLKLFSGVIRHLFQKELPIRKRTVGGLIVTHTGGILENVHATRGYVLVDGRILCSGAPLDILDQIAKYGFENCIAAARFGEENDAPQR